MDREKEEVAFRDFKSSVTVGEFEAVLSLAKSEYQQMKEVVSEKDKFLENCVEKMMDTERLPEEVVEQLRLGFKRRAEYDMERQLPDQIGRHRHLVDFINRFEAHEDKLEYLH